MERVFLDHNATTFPSKEVKEALQSFSDWGNASSIHDSGRRARSKILQTRRTISELFEIQPSEITFTSGGSESNNIVIRGLLKRLKERNCAHIITSMSEHPSVYKTLDVLNKTDPDVHVHFCPIDKDKGLDYDFIEKTLKKHPVGLVSIMTANNETGEIFDIKRIKGLIDQESKGEKIYLHSDMVQTLGKLSFNLKDSGVDFASFSSHKFYSLQGSGFLYHKKGVGFDSQITGGGQEKGRRAGTENLLSIYCFGVQLKNLPKTHNEIKRLGLLRDSMERKLKERLKGVKFVAQDRQRLSSTSMLLIDGIHGETLLMNLDLLGFEVSTGSACSSGSPEPSSVLIAMGFSSREAFQSLRVSLGWGTTQENIDNFVENLVNVVHKIKSLENEHTY